MTYVKLTSDMSLMVTQAEQIYRGDNLSKEIVFLLPLTIASTETKKLAVFLSYIRPDGTADMVLLNRQTEMYNSEYHQYVLPVTCKLSRYPGAVCMWLQFMFGNNSSAPMVAKSGECVIRISESKNMDNCLSDHQLMALYQLKKQVDSLVDNDQGSDGSGSDGDGSNGDSSGDDPDRDGYEVVIF